MLRFRLFLQATSRHETRKVSRNMSGCLVAQLFQNPSELGLWQRY